MKVNRFATALLMAFVFVSSAHAGTKEIDVGTLINHVIAGENFAGQELILTGVVLVGGDSGSGLINLGTQETYRSLAYENFVSVYESPTALSEGTVARIRVQVVESARHKFGDKYFVTIDTDFRQCLSCR